MGNILIYSLHDPRTGELRYVGKTKKLRARISEHLSRARKGQRTHLSAWLRSLVTVGLMPEMRVIEETSEQLWQARERFWINHFRQSGVRLTNGTEGGEGGATCNGKKWTEERRKHISEKFKGHAVAPHVRERMRERIGKSRLGIPPHNKMQIDEGALREMYLGQRMTAEQVAASLNVSEHAVWTRLRKLGISRSNSESHRGKRPSLETRLKQSKLSLKEIRAIERELKKGCNKRELAKHYSVSYQTIFNIKNGRWCMASEGKHLAKAAAVDTGIQRMRGN